MYTELTFRYTGIMVKPFAVFDIDGTIFRWQLYHELFDELVERAVISREAAAPVFAARRSWQQRSGDYETYENALLKVTEPALIGLPVSLLETAADAILERRGNNIYRYTKRLITQLKKKGYTIITISGSQQFLVERFSALHNVDICRGRQYNIKNGLVENPKGTTFDHKADILKQIVHEHKLSWDDSYAVGDTVSDAAMLRLTTHPIAFNPDHALFDTAVAAGWTIVVERKDMTYTLRKGDNGFFILA